jgi:hypothetical protein
LKGRWKEGEDEEEEVSRYWIFLGNERTLEIERGKH